MCLRWLLEMKASFWTSMLNHLNTERSTSSKNGGLTSRQSKCSRSPSNFKQHYFAHSSPQSHLTQGFCASSYSGRTKPFFLNCIRPSLFQAAHLKGCTFLSLSQDHICSQSTFTEDNWYMLSATRRASDLQGRQ